MSGESKAVFLSYASEDVGAAARVCAALRTAGIEVWFDQTELRGGDEWDASIRRQIRACGLFLPIISANTHARTEGYFRLEWKLAIDRSHLMAPGQPFLLPIVIDDTQHTDERIPERFRELQWTRLLGGMPTPAFVDLIRGLLQGAPAPPRELASAGSGPVLVATATAGVRERQRARRVLFPVVALGLLVLVGVALYLARDHLPWGRSRTTVSITDRSIAVLPFADMSEKRDQEYFADGMAEEIVNLLVKVPDLKVIGRTSSFQFKGKTDDLRKIGTALGATYVVEGSVRRSGDHLRVTAQLIDTRDGTHRWSETYDRSAEDVLKVQDEIAYGLVRALQLEVASSLFAESQSTRPTLAAYDSYLRGLHARDRFDRPGLDEALAHFRHALELEPSFAPAAEAVASTLYYMAEWTYLPPVSGFNEARAAAEAALKLNPKSSSAHAVLCIVNTEFDWSWSAARRECGIAAQIAPNNSFVLQAAALQNMALGEWTNAAYSIEAALANDPLDPVLHQVAGFIYMRAGRTSEAEAAFRRSLDISPTSAWDHLFLGTVLLMEGRPTEALTEMQQETGPGGQALGLAVAQYALHHDQLADAALARLKSENGGDSAVFVSEAYAFRGQTDQAFAWLDRAIAQKDDSLYAVKGDPLLKNIEVDSRYKAFLRKMNLPE